MIYISSACLKKEKICEVIEELAACGFKNIELTGGTKNYDNLEYDLLRLQDKHDLNYLLHHYFPPPEEPFVLNLASLNDDIYQKTLANLRNSINLSRKLGARKFGFHAGFFVDIRVEEIGNKINLGNLFDKKKSIQRFCDGFNILKEETRGLELYIENNVISHKNLETFTGANPLMMTNYEEYLELRKHIDFELLLDIGHLKVNANSLNLGFEDELRKLIVVSDYLHISDNDGLSDQSKCFSEDSELLDILKSYDFIDKIVTAETYGSISDIKLSQSIVHKQLCARMDTL